jgi:hypothetical protein
MIINVSLRRTEYHHTHAHKFTPKSRHNAHAHTYDVMKRMRTNVICDVQRSATTRTSRTTCPRRRRSARPASRRTATSRTNQRWVYRVKGTVQEYVKKSFCCRWNWVHLPHPLPSNINKTSNWILPERRNTKIKGCCNQGCVSWRRMRVGAKSSDSKNYVFYLFSLLFRGSVIRKIIRSLIAIEAFWKLCIYSRKDK